MEEKIDKKTRIKEWIFVIGVIVVVTIASIVAYNYGLEERVIAYNYDLEKNDVETKDNSSSDEDDTVEFKDITSSEYNELKDREGYYKLTDLDIKIYSNTDEVFKEIINVTFSNGKELNYDGGVYKLDFEKIWNYLIIRETYTSDDYACLKAYDLSGNEVAIISNDFGVYGNNPEIFVGAPMLDNLVIVDEYSIDDEKYGSCCTNEDKDLVRTYCSTEPIVDLYIGVVEKNGNLETTLLDYQCLDREDNN